MKMKNTITADDINLLTAEDYEKIKQEIEYRETTLRDSLTETLNEMRNQGDLRENDGYSMAVEHNDQNEEEITRLKNVLKNSQIVKTKNCNKVCVGSEVLVKCANGLNNRYTIVGEDNANPLENKVSYKSPIGEALLGHKVGEKFHIDTPKGPIDCEILEVS